MTKAIKVVVACGAAIAQSTMMAVRLKDEFDRRKIPIDIKKCVFSEVKSLVEGFQPDLVFTAGIYQGKDSLGVPCMNGFPIITGIGYDQMIEDVFELVEKLKRENKIMGVIVEVLKFITSMGSTVMMPIFIFIFGLGKPEKH